MAYELKTIYLIFIGQGGVESRVMWFSLAVVALGFAIFLRRDMLPGLPAAAKFFIWAFFLLIADQALVSLNLKFGLTIRPVIVYAIISCGLLATAVAIRRDLRSLAQAKMFFVPFALLVAISTLMYRGQINGPDFGALLLTQAAIPSSASFVVWPALNLLTCVALFLMAQDKDLRASIIYAAFAALALQIATMEADMWWPALFGDPNGRAGGLAENANMAAQLVVFLAVLTFSTRLAPYAVVLAVIGCLLAQSKSGGILLSIALGLMGATHLWSRRPLIPVTNWRNYTAFTAACVAMLGATVYFSPVLNPPAAIVVQAAETHLALPGQLPVAPLDVPISLEKRIESRASADASFNLRLSAVNFFSGVVRQNPLGYGTGFTNKFATGPHNTFLKLAADNGVISAIILAVLFLGVGWRALQSRTPQLIALTAIAFCAAMVDHSLMIDTIVLPSLAIGLGPILCAPSRNKEHIIFSSEEGRCRS